MNKYIETFCTSEILSDISKIAEAKKQLIKIFHADIDQLFIDKRAAVKLLRDTESKITSKLIADKAAEKVAKAEAKLQKIKAESEA